MKFKNIIPYLLFIIICIAFIMIIIPVDKKEVTVKDFSWKLSANIETGEKVIKSNTPIHLGIFTKNYTTTKWTPTNKIITSGTDKNPYWDTNYQLTPNQKVGTHYEEYAVYFDNGSKIYCNYIDWMNYDKGDKVIIHTNIYNHVLLSEKVE